SHRAVYAIGLAHHTVVVDPAGGARVVDGLGVRRNQNAARQVEVPPNHRDHSGGTRVRRRERPRQAACALVERQSLGGGGSQTQVSIAGLICVWSASATTPVDSSWTDVAIRGLVDGGPNRREIALRSVVVGSRHGFP